LVTIGTPAALKEEVGEGRLTLTITNPDDRARAVNALVSLPIVTRAEAAGSVVAYVADTASNVAPILRLLDQQGVEVAAVDQARATLDDVFLRYTGRRPRDEAPASSSVSSIFASVHGRRRHGGSR
ncbi:MAG: DUF4162 domain-containing protein, partial [Acidimicrobiales bacterium]|nr:DUF4162 domain-containing protein [Acidimicrobiales bacterium]